MNKRINNFFKTCIGGYLISVLLCVIASAIAFALNMDGAGLALFSGILVSSVAWIIAAIDRPDKDLEDIELEFEWTSAVDGVEDINVEVESMYDRKLHINLEVV